jgi:hypothetical protein
VSENEKNNEETLESLNNKFEKLDLENEVEKDYVYNNEYSNKNVKLFLFNF